MELTKTEICTTEYTIHIPDDIIDRLRDEYNRDLENGEGYYDSFEDLVKDFFTDLSYDTYEFIDNYGHLYGISIDSTIDWDANWSMPITSDEFINSLIKKSNSLNERVDN